jgi:hypothetical protein
MTDDRRRGSDGRLEITIELRGDEASDIFNFVLKDEATNSWYDNAGSNFAVSLRPGHNGGMTVDESDSEVEDMVLPTVRTKSQIAAISTILKPLVC